MVANTINSVFARSFIIDDRLSAPGMSAKRNAAFSISLIDGQCNNDLSILPISPGGASAGPRWQNIGFSVLHVSIFRYRRGSALHKTGRDHPS
jgi:hypothetical protein